MSIPSAKKRPLTARNTRTGKQMPRRVVTRNQRGFSLIELMIVVSIIGILAAIAVPNYQWGVIKAKEAVLREDLYNFRDVLDQFFVDQGKYPDSLGELVEKKYLRGIPKDPFTGSSDTWVVLPPIDLGQIVTEERGLGSVYDVHSGSDRIGTNGIPYNEW